QAGKRTEEAELRAVAARRRTGERRSRTDDRERLPGAGSGARHRARPHPPGRPVCRHPEQRSPARLPVDAAAAIVGGGQVGDAVRWSMRDRLIAATVMLAGMLLQAGCANARGEYRAPPAAPERLHA